MLDVRNTTPFVATLVPGLDKACSEHVTLVVKGTFVLKDRGDLGDRAEKPPIAEEQAPFVAADVFHGAPGTSSLRLGSDVSPQKRGTDICLSGHAVSEEPAAHVDVALSVGALQKRVRVFGDRVWQEGVSGLKISEPKRFTKIPLVYERAFGGTEDHAPGAPGDASSAPSASYALNPVGRGFVASAESWAAVGRALPNLEDPEHLIASPSDRPRPAGFGAIARTWMPRLKYAGTYDAAWREIRCPFLPLDFDDRFFHAAPADLISPKPLRGGEPAHLTGVALTGDLHFRVPDVRLTATFDVRGARATRALTLDALLLDVDARRIVVTWRVTEPCPRTFLYLRSVVVRQEKAS